ncbi:MAG TPA: PLP-dependent aminotransferase family protein [Solirubrobacteraceae bacterium]|nr:PLP-dependent aminotransferase family protein [Solirubrobacteraceae bacterium]
MPLDETSQPFELLLAVSREGAQTLGRQIEDQLRRAIRDGALRPDARVPSTRDLARQLGISRRVVVDAYAQLAAEGYLSLRQGARPRVAAAGAAAPEATARTAPASPSARFDFRPSVPDVSLFPRAAWLRSLREALATATDSDLGYGDPRGVPALRSALADYLGRVRGVVADPEHVIVTSGYTQGLGVVCRALAAGGATRIALEDPSNPEDRLIVERAGLRPVAVEVDERGTRVDDLERARADAVVLTPAHQHPTGVVLAGERRTALLTWLRDWGATAIEDDYDAEYRYDRAAVGALQGLAPDRVIYAGSCSKTLAPALRLGWLVVPAALLDAVVQEKLLADRGTARIEQLALADFLARGELDRHLRRMRARYRRRRDAMVHALARDLPEATVHGVAAGLHVTVVLSGGAGEDAIRAQARRRRVEIETMNEFRPGAGGRPPALLLGYAQLPEPAIRAGVRELAAAIRAAERESD